MEIKRNSPTWNESAEDEELSQRIKLIRIKRGKMLTIPSTRSSSLCNR